MCKLLVKALGQARDSHSQPVQQRARLLAGDGTTVSYRDGQQSVLQD